MQIDIFAKNIELNEALREFIETKTQGLEKLIKSGLAELRVEVSKPSRHHRSGPIFYAEMNLKIGGKLLRATSENYDLHIAITEAKDELQLQIKKFKQKRTDLDRKSKA